MTESEGSKDLFTRLAEVGEDAIHKIADMPAATKLTDAVNSLRTRVDDLQRRVRGLDELERRVAELEQRVDALAGEKPAPRRRTTRSGAATTQKRATGKSSE
jgi:polyhydroxyalkanoate synthesis regulator phasin